VLDLFGAGTETTSTALLWAILFRNIVKSGVKHHQTNKQTDIICK
jgi:hypothetical protein